MQARLVAFRIALPTLILVIGLGAAEWLTRRFVPGFHVVFRESIAFSDDPALVYELRPGARDGKNQISSAGLRDDESPRAKPPGTFRIDAIGDSVTYGSGVARENAYPEQLERLLAARRTAAGPRVEVLNLGVPGYNIDQIVARLRGNGLAFAPDAILYGYTLNDPQAFSIEAEALRTLRDEMARGADADRRQGPGRWLAHSRIYQLLRQQSLERSSLAALRKQMPNDPAYAAAATGDRAHYFRSIHTEGDSAARLASGLDALAALAREHELPVLVVLFPLFGNEPDAAPEAVADVHQHVADLASQRGFATLDLLPVYTAASRALGSEMKRDFMHPDALGHRVATLAMLRWICDAQWLPAGAIDCATPPGDATDAAIARVVDAADARATPSAAQPPR